MAQFDLGGVLGAVLGGGGPARGTRRRPAARGGQDLGRALAMLAGVAIEAMSKSQQQPAPSPPPPPMPAKSRPANAPGKPAALPGGTKSARGSVPVAGRDPWGGAASGKPAPGDTWAPVPGMPAPPPISAEDREGLLMLRAMIAAAKADGHVDSDERGRIADQLDAAGLGQAARDAVLAEFDRTVAPEALAREAQDPMLAAQVYAAAVAGAASVEGAERAWLDGFAKALRLDRAAAEAIERRIRGG
ncbi:DUF533 domain-containing protein [Roseomonas sp. CECT 9278]|uniref:DUF533 domain-containing protein n=1 Tax=Roseomonas sp. CECT 9278 TaxID=2845823 RepID=UPI001E4AC626|nr:DUF533 domain-containing protein [Roseomonas sp. CECT 9278]CAH0244895.1 hypothetical protein ROS9278_02988 [Roseomonas sp. CECT 9278]